MIPLRDHNPSATFPYVTYSLLAINISLYFYMLSLSADQLNQFIDTYAFIPTRLIQNLNLITVITSMFLHASFGHIFINMLFLNIFGDNLEDRLGHWKFLAFYLLCGLNGMSFQLLMFSHSHTPNLGASGAIAGLMGGYMIMFPRNKIELFFPFGFYFHFVTVPAQIMIIYWLIAQIFSGFGSFEVTSPNIAYLAHLGGFIAGLIVIKSSHPLLKINHTNHPLRV